MMQRSPVVLRRTAAPLCLALAAALFSVPALAKDLGVRGQTWPVAEPDLLSRIEGRLSDLKRSGELARLEQEAAERARDRIEAPPRVAGIFPARERRTWLFDPAITVERDIVAADGTVIAAAGTRIEPLAHHPLTRDLLFIDGTRPAEVAWALGYARPAKIVLLAGRPFDLARTHVRPFFFDQNGALSAHLGLAATPSLVTPEGLKLRITEIALEIGEPPEGGREAGR